MRPSVSVDAPEYASAHPPEAGAQVRILPGAPRNTEFLASCLSTSRLICPISDANFIARFIARVSWLESFCCAWWPEVRLRSMDRRMRQDATAVASGDGAFITGTVPVACHPGTDLRDITRGDGGPNGAQIQSSGRDRRLAPRIFRLLGRQRRPRTPPTWPRLSSNCTRAGAPARSRQRCPDSDADELPRRSGSRSTLPTSGSAATAAATATPCSSGAVWSARAPRTEAAHLASANVAPGTA